MISKELLREVLGYEIIDIFFIEGNIVTFHFRCGSLDSFHTESINIHELAHKCKEWANKKRAYIILSGICEYRDVSVQPEKRYLTYFCDMGFGIPTQKWIGHVGNNSKRVYATTEPEAIFKACQWILDNKENNNDK